MTSLLSIVRDVQRELSPPRPPKFSTAPGAGGCLPTRQIHSGTGPAPDSAGVGPQGHLVTPIDRPVARPRYPGDPFWAAEWLEWAMREAGVSAEKFRRARKVAERQGAR